VPGGLILQHPQSLGFKWEDRLLVRFPLLLNFLFGTKDRVSLVKVRLEYHH
jgi:hypothetical protein